MSAEGKTMEGKESHRNGQREIEWNRETGQQGQRDTELEREAETQGEEEVRGKEKTEDKVTKIEGETQGRWGQLEKAEYLRQVGWDREEGLKEGDADREHRATPKPTPGEEEMTGTRGTTPSSSMQLTGHQGPPRLGLTWLPSSL